MNNLSMSSLQINWDRCACAVADVARGHNGDQGNCTFYANFAVGESCARQRCASLHMDRPHRHPTNRSTRQNWLDQWLTALAPNSTTRTPATNTGYGHRQRTSSQQFYNLLYNKFTANEQKFAISQHLDMSRCWALALRCRKFVVELLWARPFWWCPLAVLSVAGVRVVEFGP